MQTVDRNAKLQMVIEYARTSLQILRSEVGSNILEAPAEVVELLREEWPTIQDDGAWIVEHSDVEGVGMLCLEYAAAGNVLLTSVPFSFVADWFAEIYQQGCLFADESDPIERSLLVDAVFNWGMLLMTRREHQQAIEAFWKAKGLAESVEECHGKLPIIALALGDVYRETGRYTDAEDIQESAVGMCSEIFGETSVQFGRSVVDLGDTYFVMGRYADAESYYDGALEIYQQELPEGHPFISILLLKQAKLVGTYSGDIKKVEELHRRAHKAMRQTGPVGENHIEFVYSLCDLASFYTQIERFEEAEALYAEVVNRAQEMSEQRRAVVEMLVSHGLGKVRREDEEKKFIDAVPLLRQALVACKQCFGEEDLRTGQIVMDLGNVLEQNGDKSEAKSLYRQALAIMSNAEGGQSGAFALCHQWLAHLLYDQGQFEEAEQLYRQALAYLRVIYGEGNFIMPASLASIARVCQKTNRLDEAEELYRQALEIEESQWELEGKHEAANFVGYLSSLRGIYQETGRLEEALSLYQSALEVVQNAFSHDEDTISKLKETYRLLKLELENQAGV